MRCFLPNLRFFPCLASLSATRDRRAPEPGDSQWRRLLVTHGDLVAADGLWVQPTPPQQELITHRMALGAHHQSFPLAALHTQLISRRPVLLAERHRHLLGTSSAQCDGLLQQIQRFRGEVQQHAPTQEPYQSQVTSPTRWTTYKLVFQIKKINPRWKL